MLLGPLAEDGMTHCHVVSPLWHVLQAVPTAAPTPTPIAFIFFFAFFVIIRVNFTKVAAENNKPSLEDMWHGTAVL